MSLRICFCKYLIFDLFVKHIEGKLQSYLHTDRSYYMDFTLQIERKMKEKSYFFYTKIKKKSLFIVHLITLRHYSSIILHTFSYFCFLCNNDN